MKATCAVLVFIIALVSTMTAAKVEYCKKLVLPRWSVSATEFKNYISDETIMYHYERHQGGYVAKLSGWALQNAENGITHTCDVHSFVTELILKLTPGTTPHNLASQIFNHALYFASFGAPDAEAPLATDPLMKAIDANFGSLEQFKHLFNVEVLAHFGSGWVWLLLNTTDDKLSVASTHDAQTPIKKDGSVVPLLVCDVWEHAYYIDHRNDRAKYFNAWWKLIDWDFVSHRFQGRQVEYMDDANDRCYPFFKAPLSEHHSADGGDVALDEY